MSGPHGRGSGGHSKPSRRGVYAATFVTGLTVALVVALVLTQPWTSLFAQLGSPAPTPTPTMAQAPVAPTATPVPTPPPISSVEPDLTWPTYMGQNSRAGVNTATTSLTAATVSHLKVEWRHHGGGTIFAQPVVANGLIYWGSWDGYEHATSLATGQDVWARYLGQTADLSCEGAVVGVSSTATVEFASVQGRRMLLVFVGGGDGIFYALNAATGAVVWQTRLGQPPGTYLWSSPAYYEGNVYMGVASLGDCPLIQGKVVKFSATTGSVEAAFSVVPNGCIGGTVWGSVTIDPSTGLLYFATGNPGACGASEPYTDAVVALHTSDLGFAGAWQDKGALPLGDSDFGSTPTLFTAQIHGAVRTMVGVANKDGVYYAFDAANVGGGPVWQTRVANVALCPACGDGGVAPGAWDGHLLYEPGGKTTFNGATCPGGLRALNPATGAVVWSACYPGPTFAALTVGPGFLIVGAAPRLLVVSTQGASTGHVLYTLQDPQAPNTRFFGAPSLAGGMVLVGDASGNLFALGL